LSKGFPSLLRDVDKLLGEALLKATAVAMGTRVAMGTAVAMGTTVAVRPLSLFIFRALSAMMRAEDEREEYAATFAPIFKTDIGLGR
jgi:hypothetical protein